MGGCGFSTFSGSAVNRVSCKQYCDEGFDLLLNSRGFLSRFFRPMFTLIRKSSHMYLLGLLFGLGFVTATEIGLLGISASEATKGMPFWAILVFSGALRRNVVDR